MANNGRGIVYGEDGVEVALLEPVSDDGSNSVDEISLLVQAQRRQYLAGVRVFPVHQIFDEFGYTTDFHYPLSLIERMNQLFYKFPF